MFVHDLIHASCHQLLFSCNHQQNFNISRTVLNFTNDIQNKLGTRTNQLKTIYTGDALGAEQAEKFLECEFLSKFPEIINIAWSDPVARWLKSVNR